MKIENIGIIGIGSYAPEKILTNEDIDLMGGDTDAEWTKEKLKLKKQQHEKLILHQRFNLEEMLVEN